MDSSFYTRVGEGKYEVHFETGEKWKYVLVETACREAINHAKPCMTDHKELISDLRDAEQANWKRLSLDAAAAIEALLYFAHYVAEKVTMSDEDWEDYHEAFTEVACRKLAKLGVISVEDDMYVYRQDEPKEVQE